MKGSEYSSEREVKSPISVGRDPVIMFLCNALLKRKKRSVFVSNREQAPVNMETFAQSLEIGQQANLSGDSFKTV